MKTTKEELFRVPVPSQTRTYKPIPNKLLIELTNTIVKDHGYIVIKETYNTNNPMTQMTGMLSIKSDDVDNNDRMDMSIGMLNSYDKTKKLAVGSGTIIFICTNGMFNSEFQEMRKHTGSIQDDLEDVILSQIQQMEQRYQNMIEFRGGLKNNLVSRMDVAHLLGEMYLDEIIKPTQLNTIKREMTKDTNGIFGEQVSLWRFYNWITEALKSEHPSTFFSAHTALHKFVERKFNNYIDIEYND